MSKQRALTQNVSVAVIGGGTGNSTLLSGLKKYIGDGLTAVVNMVDDGGSTRMLRDEYGALPPGDVRQCLVALSNRPQLWREIFNYRYAPGHSHTGDDLSGVNVGNVIIAATEDIIRQKHADSDGSSVIIETLQLMGDILDITGRVVPVTSADRRLIVTLSNGEVIEGEHKAEEAKLPSLKGAVVSFDKQPTRITDEAYKAIAESDITVIAPGDLYTSIAPALAVEGMRDALQAAKRVVLVTNLMNRGRHTVGFVVSDYAEEIERIVGAEVLDYVIYNTQQPAAELLERYANEGEKPVQADKTILQAAHYKVVPSQLISDSIATIDPNDILPASRSLIRHDTERTAQAILSLL